MTSGTTADGPIGVLLMAHGTPDTIEDMPEYLMRVRDGRPPSPELIEEISHNYRAIGGRSPLTDLTLRQGAALADLLGPGYAVAVGMRNWRPFIASAIDDLRARRVSRFIGLPLAPQFSTLSVQKYLEAARSALTDAERFECVRSFHDHPLLIDAFAERLRAAGPAIDEDVIFTAHSLPQRVIEAGDSYAREVAATAAAVAARAGLVRYRQAWQSAGRTPEPWIGPDISEVIRQRAAAGARTLLVAPIGFVCDHTEILFDLDVQASATAQACGVALRRTQSLNTSPVFIRALAALVRDMVRES